MPASEERIKGLLRDFAPRIDSEIERMFPKRLDEPAMQRIFGPASYAYDLKATEGSLAEPIWDALERGGKRWRPFFLVECCKAVGGSESDALKYAPIVEMVHNGTLMVDDIEDLSELRRNKPCTYKVFGEDVAINTGNAMYFLPLSLLIHSDLPAKKKLALYDVYAQEMINVSLGQAMDIYWHRGNFETVNEKRYLQMCAYKTGTLARMAAKFGAILGGAKKGQIKALGVFAETVGIAFQIQDDILNIFPSEAWTKGFGDDITEGKYTLLVIKALEQLKSEEADELRKILAEHTRDRAKIERAIELIKKTKAKDYALKTARKMVEGAWKRVEKSIPEGKSRETLKLFAEYLVERDI